MVNNKKNYNLNIFFNASCLFLYLFTPAEKSPNHSLANHTQQSSANHIAFDINNPLSNLYQIEKIIIGIVLSVFAFDWK
jgi:hypothetical protein